MITGIFTLLGVLIGFYLAKYLEVNKAILEKAKNIKYPPKVIKTDEVALEKEKKGEEEKKEKINLEEILKK